MAAGTVICVVLLLIAAVVFYCKFKKTAKRAKKRDDAIYREKLIVMANPEQRFEDFIDNLGDKKMAQGLGSKFFN